MRGLEEILTTSFFSKIDQEPRVIAFRNGDSNDLRGLDWERASSGVKRRMESWTRSELSSSSHQATIMNGEASQATFHGDKAIIYHCAIRIVIHYEADV